MRTFQTEDFKNGRGAVELHHAFLELSAFLDTLTGNDKWCVDFFQGLASVTMVDTSVVGCHNEDTVLIDAGILGGLDNLADVFVQLLQVGIILWSVMTCIVAHMVRIVEDESSQNRLFSLMYFTDIFAISSV